MAGYNHFQPTDTSTRGFRASLPFRIASHSAKLRKNPKGPEGPLGPWGAEGAPGVGGVGWGGVGWVGPGGVGGPGGALGVPYRGPLGSPPGARPGLLGIIEAALRENCAASKLRCEETALRANGSAGMRGA